MRNSTPLDLGVEIMVELNSHQKSIIIEKLKIYFDRELDFDIGQFDAEFLLDFFAKEVGVLYRQS